MSTDPLYPTNPYKLGQLGEQAANLLNPGSGPEWILRRKEKVTLLDDSVVRRQMSVDFTLPKTVPSLSKIDQRLVYYAPLFFLPKGLDEPFDPALPPQPAEPLFANFDLRDASGRALSLPARRWNGLVTSELLRASIEMSLKRLGKADPADREGLAAISRQLCTSDHHTSELWLENLRDEKKLGEWTPARRALHEADAEDESLARMLEVCASSSVVMTPLITREACQGIIKLSFDEQVTDISSEQRLQAPLAALGWAGYELWVETPYIGAASYHFEFQAPDGLEIYDAGLVRVDGPEKPQRGKELPGITLDRCSGFASRLHLYERNAAASLKTFAWVRLRVRRQEFVSGAAIAGVFVALTMWGAWFAAHPAALSPTSVPTLLMLVPSIIAAYAVRPSAHRLTTKMLQNARRVVVASAVLPFLAAAFLALTPRKEGHLSSHAFKGFWLGTAIAASVLAAVLIGARIFPLPERAVRRMKVHAQKHLALQFDDMPAPPQREPWIRRWREGRIGRLADSLNAWRKTG